MLAICALLLLIIHAESYRMVNIVGRLPDLAFYAKPNEKSTPQASSNYPKKSGIKLAELKPSEPSFFGKLGFKVNPPQPVTPPTTSASDDNEKKPSVLDQVASKGLAGVLAIALAEAIFWAAGMPLAAIWYKLTTGAWIDLMSTEGQLQAAGFSFGYGGFATIILQYRVTLFAIPLVPVMEKYVVAPGKRIFGDQFGEKKE